MKTVIATCLGALALLTLMAMWWRPSVDYEGLNPLVWVTGFNAERVIHMEAFNEFQDIHHLSIDPDNTGTQKIIVQISSGIGPDLFDAYGLQALEMLVAAGVVENLRPHLEETGYDFEAVNYASSLQAIMNEEGIWGYPSNVNVSVLFYNKNVFDRLGIDYPDLLMTWDQFFELANKLKVDSPRMADRVVPVSGLNWRILFSSAKGEFFSEDGTRLLLREPEMSEALERHKKALFEEKLMLRALEAKGLSAEAGAGGQSASFTLFMDGFYAMLITGKWALIDMRLDYEYRQRMRETGADIELPEIGVVMIPHFEGREPNYLTGGRIAAVSSRANNIEGAIAFIKYLASESYSETLNQGLDALPGNPEFVWSGIEEKIPALSEMKVHELTVKSMEYTYMNRASPFLLTQDLTRVLNHMVSRMESNPDLDVDKLLVDAEQSLYRLMDRNLRRDAELRERYRELTGYGSPFEMLEAEAGSPTH